MICITIGRGRHQMMIAEQKHLAQLGAKLVEMRLDFIRRTVNMKRLLENRPCFTVATCRRRHEGGRWIRSEADRLVVLRTAIAEGVDYVDLETDVAGKIPRFGPTKRIVSYHNFHETPKDLDAIHDMMKRLDPDVIKIATMANNPVDNVRVLRLCQDKDVSTTAFCMGEMGLMSRVLCGKFGAPFTYATINAERTMAPGQLTYEQMSRDYGYERLSPKTELLGVIADPVSHSLSPQVHNACLRAAGLDMVYLPIRVPSEYLDEFMKCCEELDIRGLSVTLPHKQAVLPHVNSLEHLAAGIKAVNTIVYRGHGVFGYNTDCEAAIEALRPQLESADAERPFSRVKVLILGAGGVARAIAHGLILQGAKVTVCARNIRKAEAFANEMNCATLDWPGRGSFEPEILVNATSVGMSPNMDESPFEAKWFDRRMIVFDTIYNPEQTLFIKEAKKFGCRTVTGVEMFARQAARQFELFTGKPSNLELIRTEIKKATSPARY